MTIELVQDQAALAENWPMVAHGLEEVRHSPDAADVAGAFEAVTDAIRDGLMAGTMKLVVMRDGEGTIGYDVLRVAPEGYLEGVQTWVADGQRGRGVWSEYTNQLVRLAHGMGLKGMIFSSTSERWNLSAPRAGFTHIFDYPLPDGRVVKTWLKEA